ncbi:sensor histidine kinase [Catenulispora yoronensis]
MPTLEVTIRWTDGDAPNPELSDPVPSDPVPSNPVPPKSDRSAADAPESARRLIRGLIRRGPERGSERSPEQRGPERGPEQRGGVALRRTVPQDLVAALEAERARSEELRLRNEELERANAGVLDLYAEISSELEQTNIGVVALHAELEDKSRRLREASEAKTRFWANVSHELRSPLNSVIGLSRLLAVSGPEELGALQREQVGLIAASGETLRDLVDDLLDVAKAEAGQLTPQPGPVDLALLLARLESVLRPAADPNPAVALLFPAPEELPDLVTDETMLTRILRNLISNSLKYTEAGHVRLSVRARRAARTWSSSSSRTPASASRRRSRRRSSRSSTRCAGRISAAKRAPASGCPMPAAW